MRASHKYFHCTTWSFDTEYEMIAYYLKFLTTQNKGCFIDNNQFSEPIS